MTMTDPIADMLTRIRNANVVKHETVDVPASNMKKELSRIYQKKVSSEVTMLQKMESKE